MAESPTYTTVPGKIPLLLKKIRDAGVPPKATIAWLKSVGLTSSNDATLLKVLHQIGFIDKSGVPQPAWREYRGGQHRSVLGRAIVLGYPDLYATYADAHDRTNEELSHVFSTQSSAGKQAIDKMISTFKTLAKEADFDGPVSNSDGIEKNSEQSVSVNPNRIRDEIAPPRSTNPSTNGVTININVALTLPETTDSKVFEALFEAMKKHLIENNLQ